MPYLDSGDELLSCPNCGHSARHHWKSSGNVWDDATKGQEPHVLHKVLDNEGKIRGGEYPSNGSPGNLPTEGCFKIVKEFWRTGLNPEDDPDKWYGYNYYEFCDCPIDRETVLALVRQGKVFEESK